MSRMSAKSVFSEGLIMDFAPDNTPTNSLTSALNATLITFNGNEMALLNDMGNARVETAFLPEGYIPVGTCEYGDIIYIVSYNPLLNKSQIGCFPSPERNISTDEIINGGDKQLVSESLFLKPVKDNFGMKEVINTSAKFILTKKNLNPGDKYIIYTDNIFDEPYITDIGNTDHDYGKFPKYLKIHIISIDNSNKIDYLDSEVIWYDKMTESTNKDYFINEINNNDNNKPDIDSYRNALSSGYSVFLSKVSGKLALLIELETIDTFSCTYNIYKHINQNSKQNNSIQYQDYDIYFNINWGTSNYNINPSLICLYNLYWSGVNPEYSGKTLLWWKKDGKHILGKPLNTEPEVEYLQPLNWDIKSVLDSDSNWDNVYKTNISRSYLPENLISYEEFKTKASYDKILDNTLKYIKFTQYIEDNPKIDNLLLNCSLNKIPENNINENWLDIDTSKISLSSVVTNRIKGIPVEGEYYVNANSVFIDNNELKYYTSYKDTEIKIYPYQITDDIINNYFKYSISKKFTKVSIPVKLIVDDVELTPDISNLIYNYEVAPVMPYGILPHLISKGTINFSKIGSGEITMPQWKYYNTENTSTLTIGFNIFPEENMGVAGIDIDFIDNQGIAATYSLNNNSSYSGTFTDLLPLNNSFSNYKLKTNGIHAGIENINGEVYFPKIENDTVTYLNNVISVAKSIPGNSEKTCAIIDNKGKKWYNWDNKQCTRHINDSGTLYPNFLYLAKITIKYCYKNALGEYDTSNTENFKIFYRWYWTNTMYNENYYSIEDFNDLPFELSLDLAASYNTENYKSEIKTHEVDIEDLITPENNFGSTLETINTKIKTLVNLGLIDTFNTFSLNSSIQSEIYTYIGNNSIESSNSSVVSLENKYNIDSTVLYSERIPIKQKEPEFKDSYEDLYNWHLLSTNLKPVLNELKDFEYIDYKGDTVILKAPNFISLKREQDQYITTFDYKAILFSNYYKYILQKLETLPCLKPLIYDKTTAAKYGLTCKIPQDEEPELNLKLSGMITMGGFAEYIKKASLIGDEYMFIGLTLYNPKENNFSSNKNEILDYSYFISFDFLNLKDKESRNFLDFSNKGFLILRFISAMKIGKDSGTGLFLGNTDKPNNSEAFYINHDDTNYYVTYYDKDSKPYICTHYPNTSGNFKYDPVSTKAPMFLCYVNNDHSIIPINSIINSNPIPINAKNPLTYNSNIDANSKTLISLLELSANEIVKILSQIYVKNGLEELTYNSIQDVVYLEPHKISFIYDILYKTKVSNVDNNNINLQGILLSKYLESVLIDLDKSQINFTNTNLKLLNTLKNIPIKFELTTKIPNIVITLKFINTLFMQVTDSALKIKGIYLDELIDNLLYILNEKNLVINYIGGNLIFKNHKLYKIDTATGNLKYTKEEKEAEFQIETRSLFKGWEYDNTTNLLIPKKLSNYGTIFTFNSWYNLQTPHYWKDWEMPKVTGWYKNITWPGTNEYFRT